MDTEQIEREWEAATAHVGLATPSVLRMTDQAPSDTGRGAQWWEPEWVIDPDQHLVTEGLADELNAPPLRSVHRVVVRRPAESDPVAIARFAGKLRHELEHARQWEACGRVVFQLSELADRALAAKISGLPRGRVFTNLKPVEQDANAASAMFLRKRWPDAVDPLLRHEEDAPLARSLTPPGPLETLPARMIAFLYLYHDLCAALVTGWTFAEFLETIVPGARKLWQALDAFDGRQAASDTDLSWH